MNKAFALALCTLVSACARQAPEPAQLFTDSAYEPIAIIAELTYSVDKDVTIKSGVIDDGMALLSTMGYAFTKIDDPSKSDVQFHMEHGAFGEYCKNHPGTIAYHHSSGHSCGGVWICDDYGSLGAKTLIAHEAAHALGVDHVEWDCSADSPETKYGKACGGSNIMDAGLGFEANDFTVQDAAAFQLQTLWRWSIFGDACRKGPIPPALVNKDHSHDE